MHHTEQMSLLLAHWINERYAILTKRRAGEPRPWTKDLIMRTVRFTNVHREDDRVTVWIKDHWRDQNRDHPNLTTAMVLARMVNRPTSLEAIGFPEKWDPGNIKDILARLTPPIWGNAYVITTCGKKMDKIDYVVGHVCAQVHEMGIEWESGDTLRTSFRLLTSVDGLGSFLAGQVLADLKNTPGHVLKDATDWWEWSAPGPGSLKGLSYYWGTPVTPATYYTAIEETYKQVQPHVAVIVPPIHMQDFQNCLCEFSKYMRVRDGGRAKNSYPG